MIKTIRTYYRLIMTSFAMVSTAFIAFLLQFFLLPFPRWRARFLGFAFKVTTSAMLFFMRVRVQIQGEVPRRPFFMVGNHLSYLDILVLSSVTGSVFVSKKEVRNWPVVGWIAILYRTIFLNRESKQDICRVTGQIERRMKLSRTMIVFPEGTSSGGQEVLPFYSSLLEWPARENFPVHCVSIAYTSPHKNYPAADFICWWGDMEFGSHLKNMLRLDHVEVKLNFLNATVQSNNRKDLAKKAELLVRRHFQRSI